MNFLMEISDDYKIHSILPSMIGTVGQEIHFNVNTFIKSTLKSLNNDRGEALS